MRRTFGADISAARLDRQGHTVETHRQHRQPQQSGDPIISNSDRMHESFVQLD